MTITVDRPYTAPVCPSDRPCMALTLPNLQPCGHAATVRVVLACPDHTDGRIDLCNVCLVRTAIHLATCGAELGDGTTCQEAVELLDSYRFAGQG